MNKSETIKEIMTRLDINYKNLAKISGFRVDQILRVNKYNLQSKFSTAFLKNMTLSIFEALKRYEKDKKENQVVCPIIVQEYTFSPHYDRTSPENCRKAEIIYKVLNRQIENYIVRAEDAFKDLLEFTYDELVHYINLPTKIKHKETITKPYQYPQIDKVDE